MNTVTRNELIDCLNLQWGTYVARIQGFSGKEQEGFLEKQGYARLQDLLSHVTAWWQVGMRKVADFQLDADVEHPAEDVDVFNAEAVAGVRDQPEAAVIQTYETTRLQLLDLVQTLADVDLNSPKINHQLAIEIIGHWQDHQVS